MWVLSSQEHLVADPSFFTQPLRQYLLLLTFWSLLLGPFLLVSFLSFWHWKVEAAQGSILCLFLCAHFLYDLIQFHGFNTVFRIMSLKCMSPTLISPSDPHSPIHFPIPSVQFSSVAQSCPTLCDPMNRSTPGLPAHHQLPEFTQIHVHRVRDAIQPSHPRSSPSPPAPNPSQHQSLFQWVNSSHEVAKVLEFQL